MGNGHFRVVSKKLLQLVVLEYVSKRSPLKYYQSWSLFSDEKGRISHVNS